MMCDCNIENLIHLVIQNKSNFAYLNLSDNNAYKGWVSDFHIQFADGAPMYLDLKQPNELFLLFVLAVVWSRSGAWEDAAYFVSYLKYNHLDNYEKWQSEDFACRLMNQRGAAVNELHTYCTVNSRYKIGFRSDIYHSVYLLAVHWNDILYQLSTAALERDYLPFICYLRSIKGLGSGTNAMNIKIPLILRELRCQNIYPDIPGKLCCVPDQRVKVACKELGIKLPADISSVKNLVKASEIIYDQFGDLYDIPLFAYADLKNQFTALSVGTV